MMAVFRIFLPNCSGFSGFAKKVTSPTGAKTVIPRDRLQRLEECMTSLVSLEAVVWVVTTTKHTMVYYTIN